jgi:hypothetical protein
MCRAVGAAVAALVEVEADGTAAAVHQWREGRLASWGIDALPVLPIGDDAVHEWGGELAAQLAVAGVTVVPLAPAVDAARASWALVLGWPDRSRIWDEGWVPMLAAAGALLVAAERVADAEARPSVDPMTGVANRKLFLVLAGRMLARLDRERSDGVALIACQATTERADPGAHEPARSATATAGLAARLSWGIDGALRESDLLG